MSFIKSMKQEIMAHPTFKFPLYIQANYSNTTHDILIIFSWRNLAISKCLVVWKLASKAREIWWPIIFARKASCRRLNLCWSRRAILLTPEFSRNPPCPLGPVRRSGPGFSTPIRYYYLRAFCVRDS